MKKYIILALIIITMMGAFSCAFDYQDTPYPHFKTPKDALQWVSRNIKYVGDPVAHNSLEYWQGPLETIQRGTGDCEDYAILAGWLLLKNFNINTSIIIAQNVDKQGHAMLLYDNKWLSPQAYGLIENPQAWTVIDTITIQQALAWANILYGSRGLK